MNADLLQLSVAEDITVGSVVTPLAITDADEGGAQTVRSVSNSTLFGVDEGKLIVTQALKGHAGERVNLIYNIEKKLFRCVVQLQPKIQENLL